MSMPLWAALPPVSVTAPAKVNLFLHITGRRADGYHELESLFVFTKGGDRVTVAAAPEFTFTLEGPFASALEALGGAGEGNLVSKAVMLLASHAGLEPNVAVTLEKNLPVAAGIGGGSSDAAAALLALNQFWKLKLPMSVLEGIALQLGADVPACLHQVPLLVRGIGEELKPVSLGWQAGIVLVNPMEPLSTPAVFKAYHVAAAAFDAPLQNAEALCANVHDLAASSRNALEGAARSICPAVADVLDEFMCQDGVTLARMSGSGATCFALFETAEEAEVAARKIGESRRNWWVMADYLGAGGG
ncbi:4-(cytidine 5'-diphospho)-2-C-methyl-D-erythritol kinase [Kordiimonas lacus]|uniref:4-diphosphocytidyl-2-C-methyl-D-erythritol kinase n=1 Tax=Kordiimonas lacus TaxID=637679 RepID=A0A1G7DDK1_9PROT|nr:4-(cytidine 5'-diphospho)-2-C-methyl-D-erythritol kinase [Kordiimonas lacus]SDE49583.1 4-diphosphocytidyl-2-C-methyl-D-erythritol kinase [Kordiimonas lacus]